MSKAMNEAEGLACLKIAIDRNTPAYLAIRSALKERDNFETETERQKTIIHLMSTEIADRRNGIRSWRDPQIKATPGEIKDEYAKLIETKESVKRRKKGENDGFTERTNR